MKLRGDYTQAGSDYCVDQSWVDYTVDQHTLWSRLFSRQLQLVKTFGAPQFLVGLESLEIASSIPRFEETNRILQGLTGWKVIGVPGLIPELQFFAHLAERRFPVTVWLRTPAEMDYLVEPDIFHDFFGHVPLLCDPIFADFMQAYGVAGRKAQDAGGLKMLARLYWYTVEFGLIRAGDALRAYGAGILSSAGETRYCIESPLPTRINFNLERVMCTDYFINDYQKTYFVIDSFEQLFRDAYGRDFTPIYAAHHWKPGYEPGVTLPGDMLST